ncbi:hypothetical protein D3C74_299240 [compost metagenome]
MISEQDSKLLQRCVELARIALEHGDEPFGSLLVDQQGNVLEEDYNHISGGGSYSTSGICFGTMGC